MKTGELSKDEIVSAARAAIDNSISEVQRSDREKVALTCRILFAKGHDSGLAGQITARSGQGFLTQPLGIGFDEITPENLLEVDADLVVHHGTGMPNPANRFHSWIYARRPDVRCVIHTHPLHTSALSMLEEPLAVAHMDACMLYDDVAFVKTWPGIPVGNEEGRLISEALADKRALLLAHHGLVIAGSSIEEACVLAVQFERAAQIQLLASAAGHIQPIDPALGREAHDWILTSKRCSALFDYYARRVMRPGPR
jgi:L-fuculose-phosphate aldolase